MRILLVEDEVVTASVLARTLTSWGHDVTHAADGRAAWRLIRREPFPVVLSDWMMPGMDGLELCRRVRSLDGRPYTYFIMFTSRDGFEDRLKALAAGADDFLGKPFDPRELVARLEIARRLLVIQDELERKNVALRELATTDELTGLKNRRSFFEALESNFTLAARRRSPLSLVLLDVDHFKTYNDAFGHPAGDDVLRGVADVLRSVARAHDTVARHGGEEFAVLLPATGEAVARALGGRLREAFERREWPHRPVTASLGVATMTPATANAPELVDQADRALYTSKRRGRNLVTHQGDPGDDPGVAGGPIDDAGWPRPPSFRKVIPISGAPEGAADGSSSRPVSGGLRSPRADHR